MLSMASSPARRLFVLAIAALLTAAVPRGDAWGGGRMFFSKTTRPQVAVEPEKTAAVATTAVPDAADPGSSAPAAFSRPSTSGGRGYGLYGRPEESYPAGYFRRGVHHNAEKLTTTTPTDVPTKSAKTEGVQPAGGGGERGEAEPAVEDNGSGRGRPPWYYPKMHDGGERSEAEQVAEDNGSGTGRPPWHYPKMHDGGERAEAEPLAEDNGSGRGRPPWVYPKMHDGSERTEAEQVAEDNGSGRGRPPWVYPKLHDGSERTEAEQVTEDNGSGRGRSPWYYPRFSRGGRQPEEQRDYGMSDTRLYQNGRYYYDANTGTYGYGRESNPMRMRHEEFGGGFGRGRYGNNAAAGYEHGNEFGNGATENQDGFQEDQNEQSTP